MSKYTIINLKSRPHSLEPSFIQSENGRKRVSFEKLKYNLNDLFQERSEFKSQAELPYEIENKETPMW